MPSGERYPRFRSLPPELTFARRTLDGRNQSPAGQRPRTRAAKLWGWTQLLGPTSEHDPGWLPPAAGLVITDLLAAAGGWAGADVGNLDSGYGAGSLDDATHGGTNDVLGIESTRT